MHAAFGRHLLLTSPPIPEFEALVLFISVLLAALMVQVSMEWVIFVGTVDSNRVLKLIQFFAKNRVDPFGLACLMHGSTVCGAE
jgi:hypothetical protein